MELRYTAVTIRDRQNNGQETPFQDVEIDTDVSFKALKDRHYRRHGIYYRAFYILDAAGETVYSHAGFQDDKTLSQTEAKDKEYGKRDRLAGYYDKWYRYNRKDEGRAYDEGVKEAESMIVCPESFTVIECAGGKN